MPLDYRTSDAVLTICQNNKTKSVTISEINEAAQDIVGLDITKLIGKAFNSILPPRIAELLDEYVEFEDDANDIGIVLLKIQNFAIIGRNSQEKPYRIKISRLPSSGKTLFFALILQDSVNNRKNDGIRRIISDNFKGHESLDTSTDLPDRASLMKDIDIVRNHGSSVGMLSCFALLQIDDYNKILAYKGREFCNEMLKYVAAVILRTMRPDDVVGSTGHGRLGVLLVDIASGSERLVLNRLRWQIAANPYLNTEISVSVSFCNVSGSRNGKAIVEQCEATMDGLGKDTHNILIPA